MRLIMEQSEEAEFRRMEATAQIDRAMELIAQYELAEVKAINVPTPPGSAAVGDQRP